MSLGAWVWCSKVSEWTEGTRHEPQPGPAPGVCFPLAGAVLVLAGGALKGWGGEPDGRPRRVPEVSAMRLNQNTLLLGKKVALVPYTPEHVPRYHEWMQSEELQRLTASEPLSLEQEYAMQRSWREDADKCTFIVLDAERWQAQPGAPEESCMAGDVNLFLTDPGDPTLGEIEVMIAGVTKLGLTKFEAKIGQGNEPSLQLFRKLHFEQVAVSSVFQEVTLRLTMNTCERQWLLEQTSHVQERPYRDKSAEPH